MHKRTQILTSILCLLLAISMVPSVAFADDYDSDTASDTAAAAEADAVDAVDEEPLLELDDETQATINLFYGMEEAGISYLYLPTPTVYVGETLDVLVGLEDETAVAEEATLTYQNIYTGEETTLSVSSLEEGAFSFQYVYASESAAGFYKLTSLSYVVGGETVTATLDDEQEIIFEVVPAATAETGITAYAIADDGTLQATAKLDEALDTAAAGADALADEAVTSEDVTLEAQDDIVRIMLDPGHCSLSGGAGYNGLSETTINLKIAQYCKAELEEYNGVEVYMTRTSNECPYPNATSVHPTYHGNTNPHNLADICCRIDRAIALNCDAYISLHINAGGSTGAEVWVPSTAYSTSSVSNKIADRIQAQLVSLGLNNRGVHVDGAYPDGYRVTMYGGEQGIPSMIVEHAFIDGDYAFLASEANLKNLGIADATGIAKYYNLTKEGKPAPKVTSVGDGTVVLSWDIVEHATKYAVGIYRGDGDYYYQTYDCTALTYTFSGLENGEEYRFFVQAYFNGHWSELTEADCVSATPVASTEDPSERVAYPIVEEYYGTDRYETARDASIVNAVSLSSAGIPATGIIVASGDNGRYADALSAAGLSGVTGYPVVMISGTELTSSNQSALQAYRDAAGAPLDIIIIGGTPSVSTTVENSLAAYGTVSKRLSGSDRYATNLAIYNYGNEYGAAHGTGWNSSYAFVAKGTDFPDALSIAPFLAANGCPLLLVNPKMTSLTAAQSAVVSDASEVIVLGGTGSVSASLASSAGATTRLEGADRYATSAAVVAWEFGQGMSLEGAGLATGANFPDALSCVSLLASTGSVLCLVSPDMSANGAMISTISTAAATELAARVRFFGSTSSIVGSTRDQFIEAFNGTGTEDATHIVRTYAGSNRYGTAAMGSRENAQDLASAGKPAQGLIIVSGQNGKFADALSAAGLSGLSGYPVVAVNGTGLTSENLAVLQAYKDTYSGTLEILILGDSNTVSDQVAAQLANYGTIPSDGRIAGADRYLTNQAAYTYGDKHYVWNKDYVFVAKGTDFPDALSIAPYLAANGAPLLLVNPKATSLTTAQKAVVTGAGSVIALGSTASVPEALSASAGVGDRLEGSDRYATSAEVVAWELDHGMGFEGAGLATGANFPDALGSASLLASTGSVLCLVSPSQSANEAMCNMIIKRNDSGDPPDLLRVFGSSSAVSPDTRDQILLAFAGQYDLGDLSIGKPEPTATPGNGSVTLSWSPVSGATRYSVAIRNNDGTYTFKTVNCTDTKYVVTGLTNGTRYAFLVRAYANGVWSNYNVRDCITAVAGDAQSPVVTVSESNAGLVLSWKPVPGATSYSIEEHSSTGAWMKDIASDYKGTSYTISNYDSTFTRYYLVQAYVNGNWSSESRSVYVVVPSTSSGLYAIMGSSTYTAADMVALFKAKGYTYPSYYQTHGGAPTIEAFCTMIVEEARAEGVRPEVLYAQIMHETGWLQFGNLVSIEQFNYGGLGATGPGYPGVYFPDTRTGLRAQVQHLKAYACTDPLVNACVDERFTYVSRGTSPYVEWLGHVDNPYGAGWAWPGEGYGAAMLATIAAL